MRALPYYITVATQPHIILDFIKCRIDYQEENLEVLGLEENRPIGWQSTGNFGAKLKHVNDYINRPHLHPDDIVLFTDAYDVIYGGNLSLVYDRFSSMGKPILFGAETICNPDPEKASQYRRVQGVEFPFLNSGMFIGRVWALKQCMNGVSFSDADDDQRFWTSQFFKYPELIFLDYENTLFLNTAGIDLDLVVWNGSSIHYRDKNPIFVHVNGPDKNDLRKLLL